jgi:hypothetical protein
MHLLAGDLGTADPDLAAGDPLDPGQAAQQGGLPEPDGPSSTTNAPGCT